MSISYAARYVLSSLLEAGYEAYVVGGSLRDQLLGVAPKDWDIATNARPDVVRSLFPKTVPIGEKYGTIAVIVDSEHVEVTTFRNETGYSDHRRPDSVSFVTSIEEDLARRDFTINAMAWNPVRDLVDPYNGHHDLKHRIIRAVGDPHDRFSEDPLRMLRAIRFAARLCFTIEDETLTAIKEMSHLIDSLSVERITQELLGILAARDVATGLNLLHESGILRRILPEIEVMVGYDQRNPHHRYDLFTHTVKVICGVRPDPVLRLAALLHDVGKPKTQTLDDQGIAHYYGHPQVGAEMADEICRRLKLSNVERNRVCSLVAEHQLSEKAGLRFFRRLKVRYGLDFVRDVLELHEADFRGTGTYGFTWRSRLWDVLDQLEGEPAEFKLAVNGYDVMEVLGIGPGPFLGGILKHLRDVAIDSPELNHRDALLSIAIDVAKKMQATPSK